jgi:hypothetical protein
VKSRVNLACFTGAAALAGAAVCALLGAAGGLLPLSGPTALVAVLAVGSALSAVWYLHPHPAWLPSPRMQVARHPAVYVPGKGGVIFGAFLGAGLFTPVTTPLVWVGMAASFAAGSVVLGLAYGAGFGIGRSVQLFVEYVLADHDPVTRFRRIKGGRGRAHHALGLALCVSLLATALLPVAGWTPPW